jgi:uncharacterized membrane protein YhaH (DUF805 family)
MWDAIKYNLANLTNFAGRDARQTFWYYVLLLVVAKFVLGMLFAIPLMVEAFAGAMAAARSGADPEQIGPAMMSRMGGAMGQQIWLGAAVELVMIGLLAAACVRRLHDSGKPGAIAVIPIAAKLIGIAISFTLIDDVARLMALAADPASREQFVAEQRHLTALGLVNWIGPIIVIGFGVLKSDPGPNRYGERPVSF